MIATMNITPHIFNVYKATEGGLGQKAALEAIANAALNVRVERRTSIYVGQTALAVFTNDQRKLRRVENLLYGRL